MTTEPRNAAHDLAKGQLEEASAWIPEPWRNTDAGEREQEQGRELRVLTLRLRRAEQQAEDLARLLNWFTQLQQCLQTQPRWWFLLPEPHRLARQRRRLQRAGLFDSAAYLQRYPDVAATRIDPLDHYVRHGIHEGRIAFEASEDIKND